MGQRVAESFRTVDPIPEIEYMLTKISARLREEPAGSPEYTEIEAKHKRIVEHLRSLKDERQRD